MKERVRKTRRAWNEAEHAHFLTYSCHQRLPLLTRRWVIEAMERVRRKQDVALWAYVIMPEHVHILLHPRRPRYEMCTILAGLKFPVARAAKEYLLRNEQSEWLTRLTVQSGRRTLFRSWQPGGGYDHNVFKEKTLPAITDYIPANPV